MTGDGAAFTVSMICGVSMMLLWDIIYGLRHSSKCGAVADFLLDFIWWVTFAAVFTLFLWDANSLRLRAYELFAAGSSAFLYHITVSKPIKRIFCVLFDVIFKIFKIILKILLTPAVFLYKILIRPFKNLCKKRGGKLTAEAVSESEEMH